MKNEIEELLLYVPKEYIMKKTGASRMSLWRWQRGLTTPRKWEQIKEIEKLLEEERISWKISMR